MCLFTARLDTALTECQLGAFLYFVDTHHLCETNLIVKTMPACHHIILYVNSNV